MARLPLTIAEKEARGTREKHMDPRPRDLAEIREEIADAIEGLADMRANLKMAGQGIRSKGMYLPIKTTNNQGNTVEREALNPAFKVQREAMTAIKNIKRFLVLLREEEQIAQRLEKPEHNEFEGLD
jgi:hypothetical protein